VDSDFRTAVLRFTDDSDTLIGATRDPLVLKLAGGKTEHRTLLARGPRQPVTLALSQRPESVELDPDLWVLSEKTSAKKR
jgi:hypothetical protein